MATPRRALHALILLFAAVLLTVPAEASCGGMLMALCARYEEADAVFIGRAVEVTEHTLPTPPNYWPGTPYGERHTRFDVEEVFKGIEGDKALVLPQYGASNCVVKFEPGERYLVFANRDARDGALRSKLDSPTGRVADRAEALVYCRRVAVRGKGPNFIGTVLAHAPESLKGWHISLAPLASVRVILENREQTIEAVSDAYGVFFFEDVPPGIYSVRLAMPKGFRILEWSPTQPQYERRDEPEDVTIDGETCVARYYYVTRCGSLSGELASGSSTPVPETIVLLTTTETASSPEVESWNSQTHTDARGMFRFDFVPPGEYVLVFNPQWPDAFGSSPPTFYYPGVAEPSRAAPVRIPHERQVSLGRIEAPRPFPHVAVDVIVTDAEGRARPRVMVRCTRLTPGAREQVFFTDEEGRARVHLRRGTRFRVDVIPDSDRQHAGEPIEVEAKEPIPPLRFVIVETPLKSDEAPSAPPSARRGGRLTRSLRPVEVRSSRNRASPPACSGRR